MPQAWFSLAMSPYFAWRSATKTFLAACSGGDLQRGDRERQTVVAPGHFVVREITEAPRVAGALAALALPCSRRRASAKLGIEHIRELAPEALAAFDHLRRRGCRWSRCRA